MKEKNGVEQPSVDLQEKLNEILSAKPEEVMFLGKKRKIGWIHYETQRWYSDVMMSEENIHKRHAKIAAIIVLNNLFKLKLFYWVLWRWYYYFKDIDSVEVLALLDAAKKKVQHEAFYLVIILSTGMTDLMMTMTSKEAKRIQAARLGERDSR